MQEVTHGISQQFLSDPDTQTQVKDDVQAAVAKLLQEALENGTLERALSTPAQIRPAPLPSCPHLSAKSFQMQVKKLLEDAVTIGTLSLDQAEELKNLIASYNLLRAGSTQLESDTGSIRECLTVALENGTLQQALTEELAAQAAGEPLDLFPVAQDMFPKDPIEGENMQAKVGKLLQDALNNGTLEKALSSPALVMPAPLPSCPNLSEKALKNSIKTLLEDGVARGGLSLDQAKELRDLIASYNLLNAKMQAEADSLVILDYSKLFTYKPPQRGQPTTSAVSKSAESKKMDLEDKIAPSAAEMEKDLQAQERAADLLG
jgi:polyhydroxyalkanoate synthesis regulator phasin